MRICSRFNYFVMLISFWSICLAHFIYQLLVIFWCFGMPRISHLSFQSFSGAWLYIGLTLFKVILLSLYLCFFLNYGLFVFNHVGLCKLMFFIFHSIPLILFHIDIPFPLPKFIFLATAYVRRNFCLPFSFVNGLCLRSRWSTYLLMPRAPRRVCSFLSLPFSAVWTRVLYHSQMNTGFSPNLPHFFPLTFVLFLRCYCGFTGILALSVLHEST